MRRRRINSLAALLLTGCAFGFAGGGFPPSIHTVAIIPFDNQTTYPTLAQDVGLAVKTAVETRLGLRAAAVAQADAVVRGTIVQYDVDQPLAYHGTPGAVGSPNQVVVTGRQCTLTVNVQITDQKTGHVIFDGKAMQVIGTYDPGREPDGRKKALELLVTNIVTEAHKNW